VTAGYYRRREEPGDGLLIVEMQEAWGLNFEDLGSYELAWLLSRIAWSLYLEDPSPESIRSGIVEASERAKYELCTSEKQRLIEKIASEIARGNSD
jgi:hypothetical protein